MKNLFTTLPARRTLVASLSAFVLATGLLALSGCSPKQDATAAATPASPVAAPMDAYDQVAKQGKGFTVGALMSANTVYVLFDPQCPHCGHLWQASLPLLKKVKFVWVPVGIMNAKSSPQGAALLTAANPQELMTAHEASLLAGTGGTSAASSIPDDIEKALKANTQLLNALRAESVPMVVAKNAKTGAVVTRMGAMDTATLATFLGVDQP
jgi:thiol:disulfide interchange protein DsbG